MTLNKKLFISISILIILISIFSGYNIVKKNEIEPKSPDQEIGDLIEEFASVFEEGKNKQKALELCSINFKKRFSKFWDVSDNSKLRKIMAEGLRSAKLIYEGSDSRKYEIRIIFPNGKESIDTLRIVLEPDGWKINSWL